MNKIPYLLGGVYDKISPIAKVSPINNKNNNQGKLHEQKKINVKATASLLRKHEQEAN